MYVIYVTGLGDHDPRGQRLALKLWPLWGVKAELFQMNWADNESWQTKFDRLLRRIDSLTGKAESVALVGASAGAGAAINAFAARKDKLAGCVLIAGKVNNPDSIGQAYRRKNPAFVESAYEAPKSLLKLKDEDRARVLSRYGLMDEMVRRPDSVISGAVNQIVPSIGHFLTIALQITIGAPSFIRFLKKQSKPGQI
jgi:pimeloyl-ACP methyl ester carboxylesterase